MKKVLILAIAAFALSACGAKSKSVYVTNTLDFERRYETVEIPWAKVQELLPGVAVEGIVVCDADGAEIPSQVVYRGEQAPVSFIFQATVPANSRVEYTLRAQEHAPYPAQVFGRYVPERKDDYAWENDMTAWRAYGPALENETLTPGIDVWNKRTPNLIIDKWYKLNDYHHDHGEGMDCYKVGVTLGGGSCAPIVDTTLVLSRNYAEWATLDNGPLRTTVKLIYASFDVAGTQVSLVKYISLDAHTRFNRMENFFAGEFDRLPVAAGMPIHNGARCSDGEGWVALTEPASDSKQPAEDGDISLAVVMKGLSAPMQADGHLLLVADALAGEPFVYWAGSGWSKNGIADDASWIAETERQAKVINAPLEVEYAK